jgi:hypothetical protein
VLLFRITGWQELVTVKSIGTVSLSPERAVAGPGPRAAA